jgi:outer membrane receptor protein involved in Fe transport
MKRIATLLLVTFTLQTYAQTAPGKQIGEVTLFGEEQPKIEAATKTEIPISKAPASVTVVTAKQIGESGARTVPDLLRLVAGVNVRWNPMTATIDIRGFGENPFSSRVLILIDGAPFNSGDTGGFPLSPAYDLFPIEMIKRIEIVRGPGSSLYGENAYWGVINIVTLSGEDLAGGAAEVYAGGRRDVRAGNVMWGRKGFLAGVKLYQTEPPTEFWMDDHSHQRASEVFLKGTWRDFQAEVYRHDDRLDGFHEEEEGLPLPPGNDVFASAHSLKQTMDVVALRYNHAPDGAKLTYAADLSWAHRDGMHCAGCHALPENPVDFGRPENHGYQAIGDFRLGVKMIPGHDVLLGTELRRLDRGDHKKELTPGGSIVSGYDKAAFYAQDQFDIIRDKLRATVGLRYDRKTDITPDKTSPRVALVYTPSDRLVLRGNYSTAFRFPTFSELYQSTWFINVTGPVLGPIPLAMFNPNPNLRPEEIRQIEASGEYQITPTLSGRLNLYRSRVSQFIVITEPALPGGVAGVGWENHPAQGTITGAEAELRANVTRGITGFVNWAHQTEHQNGSGVDSVGTPLEFVYAPKNKVNLGAYGGPFDGFRGALEVAWRSSYVGPRFVYLLRSGFTDPTIHPLPSYALVNARVGYDLPTKMPLRVSIIGNNLLNQRPEETIIGVPGEIVGREIFGQVEVHF